MPRPIVRVAVPSPLRTAFDYWAPRDLSPPCAGSRVTIPFGKAQRVGIVLGLVHASRVEATRLRPVTGIIDDEPCLPSATLALLEWAASYYHYPIGEVVFGALPALLRRGRPARLQQLQRWRATAAGNNANPAAKKKRSAPRIWPSIPQAGPERCGHWNKRAGWKRCRFPVWKPPMSRVRPRSSSATRSGKRLAESRRGSAGSRVRSCEG